LEAEVAEHGERLLLQLGGFRLVRHIRDFLLEEIVLPPGEVGELRELLLHVAVLGREQLLGDLGDLLLLQVPEQITRPVLARHALDVRHGRDVGELARLLLLQRREKLRQRCFVALPCLFHRLLLGVEAFELFGGFVLTAEKIALAQPLALGQAFLGGAGEARKELLVLLRPRPRRLDGSRVLLIGTLGLFVRLRLALLGYGGHAATLRIRRGGAIAILDPRTGPRTGDRTRGRGLFVARFFLAQLAQHRGSVVRRQRRRRFGRRRALERMRRGRRVDRAGLDDEFNVHVIVLLGQALALVRARRRRSTR